MNDLLIEDFSTHHGNERDVGLGWCIVSLPIHIQAVVLDAIRFNESAFPRGWRGCTGRLGASE